MGRRVDYIKSLNAITSRFTDAVNDLWLLVKKTKDEKLIKNLSDFVRKYSALNYDLNLFLIGENFKGYVKDKEEKLFEDIVKPLKDEMKEKGE